MGYDIVFYAVHQTVEDPSKYRLYAPLEPGKTMTSARAYQWQDLMLFRQAPEFQLLDLDLSWMTADHDVPEGFDEYEPEQAFDGTGVVFDPQLILADVYRVKQHIEKHQGNLPSDYYYQVHHADATKKDHRSAFWMWREGELWSFASGWNRCEGRPTSIKVRSPSWTEQYFDEIPDASRTLQGWDFPEGGLEGYVLPTYGNHLQSILGEQKIAQKRALRGEQPERVTVQKRSYAQYYAYDLTKLIKVCELAAEQGGGVLVIHSS